MREKLFPAVCENNKQTKKQRKNKRGKTDSNEALLNKVEIRTEMWQIWPN